MILRERRDCDVEYQLKTWKSVACACTLTRKLHLSTCPTKTRKLISTRHENELCSKARVPSGRNKHFFIHGSSRMLFQRDRCVVENQWNVPHARIQMKADEKTLRVSSGAGQARWQTPLPVEHGITTQRRTRTRARAHEPLPVAASLRLRTERRERKLRNSLFRRRAINRATLRRGLHALTARRRRDATRRRQSLRYSTTSDSMTFVSILVRSLNSFKINSCGSYTIWITVENIDLHVT